VRPSMHTSEFLWLCVPNESSSRSCASFSGRSRSHEEIDNKTTFLRALKNMAHHLLNSLLLRSNDLPMVASVRKRFVRKVMCDSRIEVFWNLSRKVSRPEKTHSQPFAQDKNDEQKYPNPVLT